MKFGKQIQAEQIPGWSAYYLDYKFLKKIISSLAANRPASEAAALALGVRPVDSTPSVSEAAIDPIASILHEDPAKPPITSGEESRSADFQAHKAAFFFKLERELEKINAFYLQKEAELKLRLETLLSKRRTAAMRGLPEALDVNTQHHVEWSAVEEGFRLLERDLGKIQKFIELNATGFRKILKKWDKRSKSTTKELYLARQVDVQPVFNRQLISQLADTVAICLLDLTDLTSGLSFEGQQTYKEVIASPDSNERNSVTGAFYDLQKDLQSAVALSDEALVQDLVRYSEVLARQDHLENGRTSNVTRILWRVITDAPPDLSDLILNTLETPFNFDYVDDINGRGCLHEAAMYGAVRLVDLCISKIDDFSKVDLYGRSPLHYAAMKGYVDVCRSLLTVGQDPDLLDLDNCSPLLYATMAGNAECVKILLEKSKINQSGSSNADLNPLSLASKSGNVDIILLLLQHNIPSVPNTNGEYPIHLAAREGFVEICRLLRDEPGWDLPDKYQEWTPLFHAARHGRTDCVLFFLEKGCRDDALDENNRQPIHYAAWYGHAECTALLHRARAVAPTPAPTSQPPNPTSPKPTVSLSPVTSLKSTITPNVAAELDDSSDIDLIPSLTLPPPIMPHRIYGHNYLDKNSFLIQVSIGSKVGSKTGVQLHSRFNVSTLQDLYLPASTPLKLVMVAGSSSSNAAPYSISLPQRDELDIFVFQVSSLSALNLEFSIYPNFGSKTIGRAVALPSLFTDLTQNYFILPILDHRLHVIGELSFHIEIVTPYEGVTLEVGGAVETYWKSNATAIPTMPSDLVIRLPTLARNIDSTHTSPSNISTQPSEGQPLTLSSVTGAFTYIVVQVTRDWHPVVFSGTILPGTGLDVGVCDITLAQFDVIAKREGFALPENDISAVADLSHVSTYMVSLSHLLQILPASVPLTIELAYPTQSNNHRHDPNQNLWVDAVLRTIYTKYSPATSGISRKITFTSFAPEICCAVNWKQPNYPVFFSSTCGNLLGLTEAPSIRDGPHNSLAETVEFARLNNLLGILIDADVLIKVPSLVDSIRGSGLLVCVFTTSTAIHDTDYDAVLRNGQIQYIDHSHRELA